MGLTVGVYEGAALGMGVGATVGPRVGVYEGAALGMGVGALVGLTVGVYEGARGVVEGSVAVTAPAYVDARALSHKRYCQLACWSQPIQNK